MKITGTDTRMIEVSAGEWVEVRGKAIKAPVTCSDGDVDFIGFDYTVNGLVDHLTGKRVLILELVEPAVHETKLGELQYQTDSSTPKLWL